MSTRLTNLKVNEISGVDDPANELPDWLVAKSKEWKNDMARFQDEIGGLYDGITSDEADLYFQSAPDEVVKARQTLALHMARDVEESEAQPTRKSIGDRLAGLFKGTSGVPNQPVIGTPAKTRTEDAERVTPAMAPYHPEEQTGPDPQVTVPSPQGVSGTAVNEYSGDEVAGVPNQPVVGTPAKTRTEDAERVTPAMAPYHPEEQTGPDPQQISDPRDPNAGEQSKGGDQEAESAEDVDNDTGQPKGKAQGKGGKVKKSADQVFAEVLAEQLAPVIESVGAIADRLENVEKASAASQSLEEQDFYGEPVTDLEKAARAAMNGRKVTLT